ncbi:MAG: DUF5702 domain-containing protein [Eubacteriales bacterium]|nr:DUF5702 domain-containing protein [Eubacteriales bacterium]
MKLFEKKRTRGAISIFLVMIIVPTMLLSAVLIDGSRMASARAITQEATDLAAASALSAYNQELKDTYGLFAIQDPEQVETIYKESLSATLMASGLSDDEAYSEKIWEILKSQAGAGNPYKGQEFLNLYDFSVDSCEVEPLYSLVNQSVLENQMVEHAKFRGIYIMADRLELLKHLGEVKEEARKNTETAEVMEDKMEVDEANVDADRAVQKLNAAIGELNAGIQAVNTATTAYINSLKSEMQKIQEENTGSDDEEEDDSGDRNQERAYSQARTDLKRALEQVDDKAGTVLEKAGKAEEKVQDAIDNLKKFQQEHQAAASGNKGIEGMVQDAEESIKEYEDFYLRDGIRPILSDSVLNRLKGDHNLGRSALLVMEQIDEAIRRYIDEMPEEDTSEEGGTEGEAEEEEEEEPEYYFYYLSSSDRTTEIDDAIGSSREQGSRYYYPALRSGYLYFCRKTWSTISPAVNAAQGKDGSSTIDETFAESQSNKSEDASDKGVTAAPRGQVDEAVYNALPSRSRVGADSKKENKKGFFNKEGDLSSSRNIIQSGKNSMLLDLAETARDDTLCLTYMFGTFKSRLTGVSKFTDGRLPGSDSNSKYLPKWRYIHPGGEIDMRFAPKKDRNTVLRGELEYLVYGNRTDQANEDGVYATIYAERMVNNLAALYMNDDVNDACDGAAAAAAVASATLLVPIPQQVFFWIFLTAWSVAETYMDMHFLVDGGYRIPLLKTSDNVLLQLDPSQSGDSLIQNYGEPDWKFVCYEDYLLILLLVKGEDKRLMRTADLVEMNMKKQQSDFTMAKAFTYLKADTDMSLRYLFGGAEPFKQSYEQNGVTGRMKFKSMIYQGY